jgi:hypothetical protein
MRINLVGEKEINDNDIEIIQLKNEVYRFIQKSNNLDEASKDFRFKIRKGHSISTAKQSVLARIIRKKLKLMASDHIEIVDDSEGN